MRTRRIGSLEVSEVGLGCNNLGSRMDAVQTDRVVGACLDAGVTFFDTAEMYGGGRSEELLGSALGSRRHEAVIATKFGWTPGSGSPGGGASVASIERAVDGSLRRLGTDHIDLYQLHKPDPGTPIDETLGALHDLVTAGKVVEIGCSNFSVDQIEESVRAAVAGGFTPFAAVQNRFSLLYREPEAGVLDACRRHGLGFLPYFPLHSGVLTGKYGERGAIPEGTRLATMAPDRLEDFYNEHDLDTVGRLTVFCETRGRSLLELAFSWLLAHDVVSSVIAGATRPEQVAANAGAAGWRLDAEELAKVDAVLTGPN